MTDIGSFAGTICRGPRRKLKGAATVRLDDGTIRLVELHWFKAHGTGNRKMRIKTYLDQAYDH
jgi:hypothetical protein